MVSGVYTTSYSMLKMNKVLASLLFLLMHESAYSECRKVPIYEAKYDFTWYQTHGSYDCVLAEQMESDDMLAGYWFEEKPGTLFIVINNIRVGKDIDLDYYGFNENYINSLLKRIDNAKAIKLRRRFSYDGSVQPQIELRLEEAGFKR